MTTLDLDTPAPASLLSNFIDVIAAPATAFRRISAHHQRSWWLPALLSVIAPLLTLWLTRVLVAAEAQKQIDIQISTMPPEQIEASRPMLERFSSPEMLFATGAGMLIIGLLLAWLIAAVLIFFGASLSGSDLKIGRVWPVVVWSWLPFALRGFVQAGWSAVNNSLIAYPGLSYFLATGDTAADQQNMLLAAAAQVDLLALWHVILVYVIFRHVARLGGGGSFILTLLYAAISIGLRLLPVLLGSALTLGA